MKRTHHTNFDPQSARFHHDPADHHDLPADARRRAGFGGRGFEGFGPGFGPGFGGFGPGGGHRGRNRAGRGDVRSAILSLLADGPSNGYGLIKAIAEKSDGAWRPSPGSVYPTLQQLVDEELIVSNGDARRPEYELTDAGRAYVDEHADALKNAWDATSGQSEAVAEFHQSVAKLMGVVHQVRFAGTDAQRKAAIEKLDQARRDLYLILAD